MEETVIHHICYIPEISIEVTRDWVLKLQKTGNTENEEKREELLSAIKRWIYLSWLLQEKETLDIKELYSHTPLWDEINRIREKIIPEIVSPHKIAYITPEFTLKTGKLIQLNKNQRPVELDFTVEYSIKIINRKNELVVENDQS